MLVLITTLILSCNNTVNKKAENNKIGIDDATVNSIKTGGARFILVDDKDQVLSKKQVPKK
ncbi:MAG: hypothetical protein IPL97_07585 [Niastella sp.]|nr:hypothetical protein [Niastella sp.]